MARAVHPNPAVENGFQSAEREWGWTMVLAPSKAEFIVYCKPGTECGRVTTMPMAGFAAQQWQNLKQRHFRGHK